MRARAAGRPQPPASASAQRPPARAGRSARGRSPACPAAAVASSRERAVRSLSIASFRARIASTASTAVTPNPVATPPRVIRWRLLWPRRLARTNSRWSGVGCGSTPGGDAREVLLGVAQVGAAQEQALLALALLPLARPDEQPSVRAHPLEVGLERLDERADRGVVVVGVAAEDPVARLELRRDDSPVGVAAQERDDPLALLERVRELAAALVRVERVRRDHERERVRRVDARGDLVAPHRRRPDVVQVDPDVLAALLELGDQPADPRRVLARVGEEDVRPLGVSAAAGPPPRPPAPPWRSRPRPSALARACVRP